MARAGEKLGIEDRGCATGDHDSHSLRSPWRIAQALMVAA